MRFMWTDDDDQSFHAAYMRDQFDRAMRKEITRVQRIDRRPDVVIEVQPTHMIDPIDPRRI